MSFREKLLARVDKIRKLPHSKFDMRQNTVDIVIRQWSGEVAGQGTHSDRTTRLYINGSYNIRVREVTSKDVIASGGQLTEQHLKVGPFTPRFASGGLANEAFDPPTGPRPQEILFIIKGLGMGKDGRWFKRVNDHSIQNYSSWLYLEATGEQV